MNTDTTTSAPKVGSSAVVLPLRHDREEFADWGWIRDATGALVYEAKLPCSPHSAEADEHRRNKTDPAQGRVDALLKAFEIVHRLAEWSRKYPRQQIHSFSAKVDEQLIAIEEEAKALLDGQNVKAMPAAAESALSTSGLMLVLASKLLLHSGSGLVIRALLS